MVPVGRAEIVVKIQINHIIVIGRGWAILSLTKFAGEFGMKFGACSLLLCSVPWSPDILVWYFFC